MQPNLLVGSLQQICTDSVKLIRNLTSGTEEFYDLKSDPAEQNNIIDEMREKEEVVELRRTLNSKLLDAKEMVYPFTREEKAVIEDRLRRLGYLV